VAREAFEASVRRLARAVRARRLALNLTQEYVAFEAGLSPRHYQQLESGAANPTYATLFEVARVLDVAVADLLDPGRVLRPAKRRATRNDSK
jgi:transcriptional regulator with XRE-family HTH domain